MLNENQRGTYSKDTDSSTRNLLNSFFNIFILLIFHIYREKPSKNECIFLQHSNAKNETELKEWKIKLKYAIDGQL